MTYVGGNTRRRQVSKIELWVEGRAHRFGVDARVYFWLPGRPYRTVTRPSRYGVGT